jgi:hypothetical protein
MFTANIIKGHISTFRSIINPEDVAAILNETQWSPVQAYDPIKQVYYRPKKMPKALSGQWAIPSLPTSIKKTLEDVIEHMHSAKLLDEECHPDPFVSISQLFPEDKMSTHDDTGGAVINGITQHIVFSVMIYLEECKGGELFFPETGDSFLPAPGRVVVFSADVQHGVKPLLSKQRTAILFRYNKFEKKT